MSATGRREKDRAQQRSAANSRIGHDRAYRIIYGPRYAKLAASAASAFGLWWIWHHVDHLWISLVNAVVGAILLAGGVTVGVKTSAPTAKMMRRATRRPDPQGWIPVSLAGVALLVAAYFTIRA